MREISLNILDIAQNSITANATEIRIDVRVDTKSNRLKVSVADNGCGMSEEFLRRVTDPFTTTRTTRKVGLGIPLFKDSAESTGGSFEIKSKQGEGTTTTAVYVLDSIDRMPLGNLQDTIALLIMGKESIRYIFTYSVDGDEFVFDTDEVKNILGDVPLSSTEVIAFLKEYIENGIKNSNGGKQIL